MQTTMGPSILLVAEDSELAHDAALELAMAGHRVKTSRGADEAPPLLVVRHWADRRWVDSGSAPVLTLDLTAVRGSRLVAVVCRALGLCPRRGFASAATTDRLRRHLSLGTAPARFAE